MNTTAKPKPANVMQQFRDVTDTSTKRSKEVFETIGAATTEAAEVMTTCCSTALKGIQDYNNKLLEFASANTASYVDFVKKLASVRSPSEFVEVSTEHGRYQLETVAEQAKQLGELAQKMAEPVQTALAKSYKSAA
jgi:phasin